MGAAEGTVGTTGGVGRVAGTLTWPDGKPVANVTVTLGLAVTVGHIEPARYWKNDMHYGPQVGPQEALRTRTDAAGAFVFENVPAGEHAFLAVELPALEYAVPTRFLAHGVHVGAGDAVHIDRVVGEWTSAPAAVVASPFGPTLTRGGVSYRKVAEQVLTNPFCFDFDRQLLTIATPGGAAAERLLVLDSMSPEEPVSFQRRAGGVAMMTELPAYATRVLAVYEGSAAVTTAGAGVSAREEGEWIVIETGVAAFRIPGPRANADAAPLSAVRGADGLWRGAGRMAGADAIKSRQVEVRENGPVAAVIRVSYALATGAVYIVELEAHAGEAYLLGHEISPTAEGVAFEFSLREFVKPGGRGYMHWTQSNEKENWTPLTAADVELARLQESVPWWWKGSAFAYGFTAEGAGGQDFVGVFTRRRGEWVDRAFEDVSHGPGDDRRELDWPYCEMVGSTISMITVHTDATGDAFFRFGLFDGERKWGIAASTVAANTGTQQVGLRKEISRVQHKNSSPRLQEFKDWRLDEQDQIERPCLVARRGQLIGLRRKKDLPRLGAIWKKIIDPKSHGARAGLVFAVDNDPLVAWRKKIELAKTAEIRCRMTLLGRDYGDMYSPVGARPIAEWIQDYDLIASSGAFTAEEERGVRQFFMLMAHMYHEPDLMNWHYNSRNANFEADRLEVVGLVGLAFRSNPDGERLARHAASRIEKSLAAYCTPGSGKWYENPPCYYLQSMKAFGALCHHMGEHGFLDPLAIPKMRDFLSWGLLLLMPPAPRKYDDMRLGVAEGKYAEADLVRRIPPIGDHAGVGGPVPDQFLLMSRLYRKVDPTFADALQWAYVSGGCDGKSWGNWPQTFASADEADLALPAAPKLVSRRLEGFGAIFRGAFDTPQEFYALLKLGPGGYRYHCSEGSLLLFANGKPLIYEGGEAGETWRHTTLSFHTSHAPLAAGHLERFADLPALAFTQGVNPKPLGPGEPIFLSDNCDWRLVGEALRRFAEPDPANVRTLLWIKGATDGYLVLDDDLHVDAGLVSHWHLNAVADTHTGNAADGFVFRGRFGTDLQVLLPGQAFAGEQVKQSPIHEYRMKPEDCFSTRHLMLDGMGSRTYTAVLRPIAPGEKPVTARLENIGAGRVVSVTGEGIDDCILLGRESFELKRDGLAFRGRYGAVVQRGGTIDMALLDGAYFEWQGLRLESAGETVWARVDASGRIVSTGGRGKVITARETRTV